VLDEAAHFVSEEAGDRCAEKVWEALVPATAQFGSAARIILSSTPYGTSGLFADIWHRADAGEIEDAVAQHFTTQEVNPTISESFLALEEKRDPDSFRAEYLAEFTSSGDSFLDFSRIDDARAPIACPEAAQAWVAGCDPAFSRDAFGLALVGRTEAGNLVVGPVKALQPEGAFSGPTDEVAEIAKEYNARCVTDQFSSAAIVDRLRNHHALDVKLHTMTAASKTAVYQSLRAALYSGELTLPDSPSLVAELKRLRTNYTSGQAAVVNPRVGGSHGDQAQALALAVHELSSVTPLRPPIGVVGYSRWAPVREKASGGPVL
jgi:hypothetical protein